MGHSISGVIARKETITALPHMFGDTGYADLTQDFVFLPLDDANLGDIIGPDTEGPVARFAYLTPKLVEHLCKASQTGAIAYVETGYVGGMGHQSAIACRNGAVVLKPQTADGAINRALEMLDAEMVSGELDLFDSIQLGRYRSNRRLRLISKGG